MTHPFRPVFIRPNLPFRRLLVATLFVTSSLLHAAPVAAATLAGLVVGPDDRPARDVRLVLDGAMPNLRAVRSDDQGRFTFDALPEGRYVIRTDADRFRGEPVTVELGCGETRSVVVRLQVSAAPESIVVSASPTEIARSTAPSSVTVLTARDLAIRQHDSVVDALRLVPGLQVVQSGTQGAVASFFPRGGESDYTMVLADGLRLNAFGGEFDAAHLPLAGVDRIEIVRGPQSATYGSDAIGSVVQIVTRRGGPLRGEALVEGGTFDTRRANLSAAGSSGPLSWGAAAEYADSDGFDGRIARGEPVTNDDDRRADVTASAALDGRNGARLRADVRYGRSGRGFPGPFGSDPGGTFPGIDRISRGHTRTAGLSMSGAWPSGPTLRFRGQGSFLDYNSRFASPFGDSLFDTRRITAGGQLEAALGMSIATTAGIEYLGERADNTFVVDGDGRLTPVERSLAGAFAEARYQPASTLLLTAGVRAEWIRRDALAADPGLAGRPAFDADRVFSVNPKLAVSLLLRSPSAAGDGWTRIRASAGTGIRAPNASEIAFTDNPSLEPERSRSVEAGLEHAILGGAVVVDATAFWNRFDDLIVAVGPAFGDVSRFRTDNIANARSRGVELSAAWRHAGLDLRAGYTFLDTEILAVDGRSGQAPAPFEPGDPLVRRPRHQGFVEATLTRGRLAAFARAGGRGRTLDIDPTLGAFGGTFRNPGYARVDAGASWEVRRGLEPFMRVANLLDARFEEALGFPAPGRAAIVGIRLAASR